MIFNSTIISNNSFYLAELASFLSPAVGLVESKWKLCYNALANGRDLKIFHRNCDNKYHTVTIIEKRPYIFGGYTDIPWDSYGTWGDTLKAFIFSLKNSEGLPPFKCFAENERKAIYKSSAYGPSFGEGPFLRIFGKTTQRSMAVIGNPYRVPKEVRNKQRFVLVGTYKTFSPDNFEVFYLA
ncbi:PREDICTED: uncharacterized protein LOC107329426 [Acropora digitifera]|uniref:uncharacterized protein LOC107329426 n=1 Tax=Acropora digitifera TaxID=70779 RepID=UPI00077A519D|nr:PREDICTED: uncharacterized protein LOC107329426 [Acropora digitifera]